MQRQRDDAEDLSPGRHSRIGWCRSPGGCRHCDTQGPVTQGVTAPASLPHSRPQPPPAQNTAESTRVAQSHACARARSAEKHLLCPSRALTNTGVLTQRAGFCVSSGGELPGAAAPLSPQGPKWRTALSPETPVPYFRVTSILSCRDRTSDMSMSLHPLSFLSEQPNSSYRRHKQPGQISQCPLTGWHQGRERYPKGPGRCARPPDKPVWVTLRPAAQRQLFRP